MKGEGAVMEPRNIKQVIAVRKDLGMRKGKLAAQVAHASMKFITDNNVSEHSNVLRVELSSDEADWLLNGTFTKVVVGVDSEDELEDLVLKAAANDVQAHKIVDAGRTEFHGVPTLTCVAFGPDESEVLDRVTGHLKLL